MKLRIKGDSLRLRLTRGEVSALADGGVVEDRLRLGAGQTLTYRIASDPALTELTAGFAQGVIEVRIPPHAARQWCDTDLVTLERVQRNAGVELRITVEKDFACLAPRTDEDESDHFPHPEANRKSC